MDRKKNVAIELMSGECNMRGMARANKKYLEPL